jgi:hypothetical protein
MNGGAQNGYQLGLRRCQMFCFAGGGLKKYTEPHATSYLFLEFCHRFATLSSVHIPIANWHLAIRLLSGVPFVDLTSVLRVNTT